MNTHFCNATQSNRVGQCSDCHCGPTLPEYGIPRKMPDAKLFGEDCQYENQEEGLRVFFDSDVQSILIANADLEKAANLLNKKAGSSKTCPHCGCIALVQIRTQKIKICVDCKAEIPWPLDEGQKAVGHSLPED